MKAAIHYSFEAKLIKWINEKGEYEFIETCKEFSDEQPIKSREAALNFYQNFIDVLLEYKGLRYVSEKQAREGLESFYDPKTATSHKLQNGKTISIKDSLGNGIGVYMIIDEEYDKNDYSSPKELIHGFGDLIDGTNPESIIVSLERELEYYKHYNYNTADYQTEILFCNSDEWMEGYREDEPSTYEILKTPFDWTGMDKPYWWGEPEEEKNEEQETRLRLEDLIADGEKNTVEFKPCLVYNFNTKCGGIGIKAIIAKAICAFLNSNGGFLLIGVNDEGKAIGLEYDFGLSGDKNPRDFFRLEFDNTIRHFFTQSVIDRISGDFHSIDGRDVFVITVFPSKSRPVFLNGQNGKEFYVRWNASSIPYTDIEEIVKYCLDHWTNE